MKKQRMLLLIFLSILVLLVGGCKSKEELQKEEQIRIKTEQVAKNYFKENYDVNVVFTEYDIMPAYISNTITLYGHVEGMKDQAVYIIVDRQTDEVSVVGIAEEFKKKY